ncbi:MAG: DUF885 domain-containing protein [Gemmatimonadales bacterium]|nr:MAG: DUF885 domain-containing protein [Gemmatimonadales bacterium]
MTVFDSTRLLATLTLAATASCAPSDAPKPSGAAATALRVAQEFVDGYYHQFPEEAFEVGYPDTPMDRLGDRGAAAMAAWRAREDGWLAELRGIDPAALEGTDAAIPYAFTLDRLEAWEGRRVCRTELWHVSPTWSGWQSLLASTFAVQPVTTPAERVDALARLRTVPTYLDTEIANLRAGMAAGYLAPATNVTAVLRQVDAMLASAPEKSPVYEPASRAGDESFVREARGVIADSIYPAIRRYRDYLAGEYHGREPVGVTANPDGAACYAASVRFHTSLAIEPREIHETGLREMERIQAEMKRIARQSFGTEDVKALLQQLRTDPKYTFRSEDDVIAYARAGVDRAAVGVHDWFGFVPDAKVVIKPFPAYQEASGGGFYSSGSLDGTRPGTYELGTYRPETISKAGMEATAFHETYPGHHLQMSVALYGKGVHPVLRYIYVSGMAEGWGLYSELLADEMGLYSSEMDRLGMLSNQALRAARLVVDPGMHVLGWTRDQAIQYMLDHTAESRGSIESEVDRYLAVPGQATAYMTGSLEIQRLRHDAEARLGDRFDITGFDDTVLRDGAVALPMLQRAVDHWVSEVQRP